MTERQFVFYLRKVVKKHPTSQRQLSADLGFNRQYLNRVLQGDLRPTVELARLFGYTRIKLGTARYIYREDGR